MAKKKLLAGVDMNSGYFHWCEINETLYHVSEQKYEKFKEELAEMNKAGSNKEFDDMMDEFEDKYEQYEVANSVESLTGKRATFYN